LDGWHRRIVYITGGLALQKLGRKREREVGNSAAPYSEQVPATQSTTVFLVEARQLPLRSSCFLSAVLLVLVDSSLAFALKVSYILIVVYS
jgi:hypothetical protein